MRHLLAALALGLAIPAIAAADPPEGFGDRVEALKAVSPIADFSYDYQDLLFTPVAAK